MKTNTVSVVLAIAFQLSIYDQAAFAQSVSWEYLSPLPEPVTNQAVTAVQVDGVWYVYSFAGIDSSLDCDGDRLRSYRLNLETGEWSALPDLPDPNGGKIAPAASTIDNKIYIVGGYHLAPNCSETSSDRIHVFDPASNSYLDDGAAIPVPIDDQVQAVWRDSLLFVVTGWSNTGNVPDVQIYNPSTDEWLSGTPVNNSSVWKVFGGSGSIVGDTLYYAGGARSTGSFSATSYFRKGYINPENPTEISWEGYTEPLALGYRMGATQFMDEPIWIGGADDTYNFDALAYNGSGVVQPQDRMAVYHPSTGEMEEWFGLIPAIMDLRGVAELGNGDYILVGGILGNQVVTDQVLRISISTLTDDENLHSPEQQWSISPNPSTGIINLLFSKGVPNPVALSVVAANGQLILQGEIEIGATSWQKDISHLPQGQYWIRLVYPDGSGSAQAFLKQ